jgi:hypothetical protein
MPNMERPNVNMPNVNMPTMTEIFARRAGRLAFGVVLILGAAYLGARGWSPGRVGPGSPHVHAAIVIARIWLAAVGAGVVVRMVVGWLPGSPSADALFVHSWAIPSGGVALVLPITLHLPFAIICADQTGFDLWVAATLWFTLPAHLVFAAMAAVRAQRLVAGRRAPSPLRIYVTTLIVSCVPFVLLLAIPPVLIAITGVPFLPLLRWMERGIGRERAELRTQLPRAAVVAHAVRR